MNDYVKDALRAKLLSDIAAEWVADQLRKCGFDTAPCGASWGVLKHIGQVSEQRDYSTEARG